MDRKLTTGTCQSATVSPYLPDVQCAQDDKIKILVNDAQVVRWPVDEGGFAVDEVAVDGAEVAAVA